MAKKKSLQGLTPDLYMRYKRRRYSDNRIGKMFNVSKTTISKWRHANGIKGNMDVSKWSNYEKVFPEEIERMKKKYMEHHNQGWTADFCGEAIGLTPNQTDLFRKRYFPNLINERRHIYTDEELAVMKKNGLTRSVVTGRRAAGMSLEDALNTPYGKMRFTPRQRELMEINNITPDIVGNRLRAGWGKRKAFTTPKIHNRYTDEQLETMRANGITPKLASDRRARGWSMQRAITEKPKNRKVRVKNAN